MTARGLLVLSIGFGPVFLGVTTPASAAVPADKAGLAASLLNASQQLGGALGLAIFTALRATNTRGETDPAPAGGEAEPLRSAYA